MAPPGDALLHGAVVFIRRARVGKDGIGMGGLHYFSDIGLVRDQRGVHLRLEHAGTGLRRSRFKPAHLRRPFDPPAVKHAHIRMPQVFQHPVHPPFIPPIVEGIRIHDHLALARDAERAEFPFQPSDIGIHQAFDARLGIAEIVPRRGHRPWNVAAHLKRHLGAHIHHHLIVPIQHGVKLYCGDQHRRHRVPFTLSCRTSPRRVRQTGSPTE